MAWKSLDKMDKILKSGHDEKLKVMLFRAPTETTLLYGSHTLSLTTAEENSLYGTFIRMLRKVKNVSREEKVTT